MFHLTATIHLHLHDERDSAILQTILNKLGALQAKVNTMATSDQVNALIAQFNDATNAIRLKIERLEALVVGQGLSEAQEAAFLAELTPIKDQLAALGADPADPVPDPVVE